MSRRHASAWRFGVLKGLAVFALGGEEAVAEAAEEAFALLAVVAPKLDEGLGGEGVVTAYSGIGK